MDTILDAFNGDAFSMTTLTAHINNIPVTPMKLGQLFDWDEKGISTLSAAVEEVDGKIRVLNSSARGSEGQAAKGKKRKIRHFDIPHYVEYDSIQASEIQGVRQFGSSDMMETVVSKRDEKLTDMRTNHELTAEFARAGAIRGVLYDADGDVIQDWCGPTGFNKPRTEVTIDITDTSLDLRVELVKAKRAAEAKLGGYLVSGFKLVFTPEMFDAFISHPSIEKMHERWMEGANLRSDPRVGFKVIEGVEVFSYDHSSVNGVDFLPSDIGYLVPNAIGLLKGRYAPADTLETANTIGLPFYAITDEVTPRSIKLESESNPLFFAEKPDAIVNISWT